MNVYKEMYLSLFNNVTTAIGLLNKEEAHVALELLKSAQQAAEEFFISDLNSENE